MSLCNFAEQEIADWIGGNGAPASVTSVFVKLHVGDPGEDATGNPATETDRIAASFGAAAGGVITSDADITWTAVAANETYTHVSVWDASTAGNPLAYGALSASVAVTAGNDFTIAAGDLTITID